MRSFTSAAGTPDPAATAAELDSLPSSDAMPNAVALLPSGFATGDG